MKLNIKTCETDHGISPVEDQDVYMAEKRLRAQGSVPFCFFFLLVFHIPPPLTHDCFPHVTH